MKSSELKQKKKRKFNDYENFKNEHQTDKLRSMLLEPRELSKNQKDKKDLRKRKNKSTKLKSFKKWQMQERSNFQKRKDFLQNKPNRKETSSSELFSSKRKKESENNRSKRRRREFFIITALNSDLKSSRMKK